MSFADIPVSNQNMMWAGYMFMNTTWIQNQMVYLLILNNNRDLITEFVSTPKILPARFVALRNQYWEKMFSEVKKEFVRSFREHLSDEDINYIDKIHMLRNMLAVKQQKRNSSKLWISPRTKTVPDPTLLLLISTIRAFLNEPVFISKKWVSG